MINRKNKCLEEFFTGTHIHQDPVQDIISRGLVIAKRFSYNITKRCFIPVKYHDKRQKSRHNRAKYEMQLNVNIF